MGCACAHEFSNGYLYVFNLNQLEMLRVQISSEAKETVGINASSREHLTTPHAQALLRGVPISDIVEKAQWQGDVRVHHFADGPLGGEVAWQVIFRSLFVVWLQIPTCHRIFTSFVFFIQIDWQAQEVGAQDFVTPSSDSSDLFVTRGVPHGDMTEMFHSLVFDDGFYAKVPRHLGLFEDGISLEIGCLRTHACGGGLQRLLVLGDRSQGGFHSLCHEVWAS